jgi:hypothetical protein
VHGRVKAALLEEAVARVLKELFRIWQRDLHTLDGAVGLRCGAQPRSRHHTWSALSRAGRPVLQQLLARVLLLAGGRAASARVDEFWAVHLPRLLLAKFGPGHALHRPVDTAALAVDLAETRSGVRARRCGRDRVAPFEPRGAQTRAISSCASAAP